MRIERIRTEEAFRTLRPEWNILLQRSAANTIFLTWEWAASWWAAYGRGKKLLIFVAREAGGSCVGIAPLFIETRKRAAHRVKFIGDGTFDSDYLDFLIAAGQEPAVLAAFLTELQVLRGEWKVLELFEIPADSPTLTALRALQGSGGWFLSQRAVPCGIRSLPKTWDEFLGTLRSRFRTTVRSCLRNMEQPGSSFEILEREEELRAWLDDLFVLHSGRWALRKQGGVFRDDLKREFYHQLAAVLLRCGWLHMTRWRLHGAVLACQFGLLYQGTYFLLQEGFDAHCNHVSPGITLRAATFRNLIATGAHTYDFLGGIGRHKTDWGAEEKASWRVTLAPRGIRGYAHVQLPVAVQDAKDKIKSMLPAGLTNWWKARKAPQKPALAATAENADRSTEVAIIPHANWKNRLASVLYHTGLLRVVRQAARGCELRTSGSGLPTLRRSRAAKFAILCYHRVGHGGVPLYSELDPQLFAAQMRFLRANYRLVSLDTLRAELADPAQSGPAVAVTFDDGYRDVYTHAFPVLSKYNIPATIFLTAHAIERNEVSWYDKIFLALNVASQEKLDLMLDKPRRFLLADPTSRLRAAEEIISWLRTLADERRKEFCAGLEKLIPLPVEQVANRMLTWEQIRTMRQAGVSFGAHTLSHPSVSRLNSEALQRELQESKTIIEGHLGTPVAHFAYPFGKPADYENTQAAVARCGYQTASTTVWGVNEAGVNPYELFRVSLGEERHLPTFGLRFVQLFLSANAQDRRAAVVPVVSGDAACSSS